MAKCTLEVSCDWTGSGELTCYGHLSTDVSQAGGQYLEAGKLTCTPVEWPYPAQVSSHGRTLTHTHCSLQLQTKFREDFIIREKAPTSICFPSGEGPSRGLLHDSEIFANLRLKL